MIKKGFLILMLLGLSTTLGWIWFTRSVVVDAHEAPELLHPHQRVNDLAKDVRNGNMDSAGEYVAELIKAAGFESELRGYPLTVIKDRVSRAEIDYRNGLSEGVDESKIVRTVNGLVTVFDLPVYTKTTPHEVTKLRLGLRAHFPEVISRPDGEAGRPQVLVGERTSTEMSPAEAVLVLSLMLQQKLANPEYQLTYA